MRAGCAASWRSRRQTIQNTSICDPLKIGMSGRVTRRGPFFFPFVWHVVSGKIPLYYGTGAGTGTKRTSEHNFKFQADDPKTIGAVALPHGGDGDGEEAQDPPPRRRRRVRPKTQGKAITTNSSRRNIRWPTACSACTTSREALFRDSRLAFRTRNAAGVDHLEVFRQCGRYDRIQVGTLLHVVFTRDARSVQLRTANCENITDETGPPRRR